MLIQNRRNALKSLACGFGSLAFAGLAQQRALADANPLAPKPTHFPAKAKRIVFLFMQGGPSHVDSFDHKPRLVRENNQMRTFDDARTFAKTRTVIQHRVMQPLWQFRQHGESGKWASSLFPHIAGISDELCYLHGMHTEGIAHGPATLFLHSGSTNMVRPSMGSWVTYGLGTENENLPGFVTLCPSMANGGPRNWGNAFLPAAYQGTPIGRAGLPASQARIRNIANDRLSDNEQRRRFGLLQALNQEQMSHSTGDSDLEAVIGSFELAYRMQTFAPNVLDIAGETAETKRLYGIGKPQTDNFGKQCLMARRLLESGVRYVQVTYGDNTDNPAWDQHSNLALHGTHALATDQPVAGLILDLKRRGLLEDTLVWWGGEFGRTPYAERNGTGRDHNPNGFTVFLAGGGLKKGFSFGATDEYGHHAVEDKVHMHDLHATLLHLMGLDHTRLTYRYAGRDYRLTDVSGRVFSEIIA
jgi:hypothetical protein